MLETPSFGKAAEEVRVRAPYPGLLPRFLIPHAEMISVIFVSGMVIRPPPGALVRSLVARFLPQFPAEDGVERVWPKRTHCTETPAMRSRIVAVLIIGLQIVSVQLV